MIFFAFLAALGLFLSAASHVSTFFGVEPQKQWPGIWLLHLGIFAVFVPAILVGKRSQNDFTSWRKALAPAPAWMRWLLMIIVIYAPLNMLAFAMACGMGGPQKRPDGTYALMSHGHVVREISAPEYHRALGFEFRFISCWWMMFYGVSLLLLVSEINRQKSGANRAGAPTVSLDRPRGLPIWLHQTILLFCIMLGWLGFPMLTAIYVAPLVKNFLGPLTIVLILGAWVIGVIVPARLVRRYLKANCPECGGPVHCESVLGMTYRCAECGHFEKRNK